MQSTDISGHLIGSLSIETITNLIQLLQLLGPHCLSPVDCIAKASDECNLTADCPGSGCRWRPVAATIPIPHPPVVVSRGCQIINCQWATTAIGRLTVAQLVFEAADCRSLPWKQFDHKRPRSTVRFAVYSCRLSWRLRTSSRSSSGDDKLVSALICDGEMNASVKKLTL